LGYLHFENLLAVAGVQVLRKIEEKELSRKRSQPYYVSVPLDEINQKHKDLKPFA
jgi:hypothetical protein